MAKISKTVHKTSEDKLLHYYYKATEYYENNRKVVYRILGVIVLIIAATIFYFRYQADKSEKATAELAKVKQYYNSGLYSIAINGDSLGTSRGLFYIVDNYGSTPSGQEAKIMLANSYFFLRDFDNALKYYESYSGSDNILKAAALAGEAGVYEAKKDYEKAASLFIKASKVSKDNTLNDEYLYDALRCYYFAGKKDKQKDLVDELKRDYPKSKYLSFLQRYYEGD
ncbi:MAG: tetratricopeptide repeat protein [Ignavibacteria bacterium]